MTPDAWFLVIAFLILASALFAGAWFYSLKKAIAKVRAEFHAEAALKATKAEELAENEALFRSLFETSAAGMALLDMSGRYFQVNDRFCRILGYTREELLSLGWRDVTHPDDIAKVEEMDRRVESGERKNFFTDRRMFRKDGTVIWTSLSSAQLQDEAGTPSLIFSFIQDITKLKEAEAQVQENERNLRNLFDSGPVGVGVIGRFTNERLFINPHLLEMMGAEKPEELSAVALRDTYVREEDFHSFYSSMREEGAEHSLEVQRRRLDGSTFWCLQSYQPIGLFQGQEACVVWLIDVSEMKQAETALSEQKQIIDVAMANMDQAISMFDDDMNLAVSNRRFNELYNIPEELSKPGTSLETLFRYVAERGDYGDGDIDQIVQERMNIAAKFEPHKFQRVLEDGRTLEVKGNPVPGGGFVTTYTDITDILDAQRDAKLLQESLDKFTDMLILYDKDEKVIFTNDRYHEIYPNAPSKEEIKGYTMEALLRRSLDAGLIKAPLAQSDPEEWLRRSLEARRDKNGGSGETNHSSGRTFFFRYGWTTEGGMILMQTDITDRKRMETELQESQAVLRTTIDNLSGGITMCDKDRRIRLFNDEFNQLMGYPEGLVFEGKPVVDVWRFQAERGDFGDVDPDEQVATMLEIFSADQEVRYERHLSNGKILEMRYSPLPGGGGVWIANDATTRITATEALAKSESQLRRILEESPIAVAISLDDQSEDDGLIQFTNRRFQEMLGFAEEDIGHARTGEFFDEFKDRDDHEAALDAGEALTDMEVRVKPRNGDDCWTLMSISPLDYDGRKSALIWLYDISELKRTQEEIAEKEAQLRMAMENMPGAMFVVDEDLNLVLVNDAYEEFYGDTDSLISPGASMEAVLKSEIARGFLVGEGSPEEILAERLRSFRIPETTTFEDRTADGRDVQLTRKPAPNGHSVSVAVDITERKQAERIIADAMSQISESIQYAARIQRAVLPLESEMQDAFLDHCVLWEPRDVVGGDVYLLRRHRGQTLLLVADCTGHGVPGAFMTMIVAGALDQVLVEELHEGPATILQRMNQIVKATLGQMEQGEDDSSDDGFECGLILADPDEGILSFSGARMELWIRGAEGIESIRGDRVGVGYRRTGADQTFEEHQVTLTIGQSFFVVSDGFIDQIGGERRRAFGKKRAKELLGHEGDEPLRATSDQFHHDFLDYMSGELQRDDLTLVGIRVTR